MNDRVAVKHDYPAMGFLDRFPDKIVCEAIRGFYPTVDFSVESGNVLDTCALENLDLHGIQSLEGLEIFRHLEKLHLFNCVFDKSAIALNSWSSLKSIHLEDCIIGHTLFPEQMEELEEVTFTRCRYISTIRGTDDGFLCLPEQAPKLKKITITDTVRHGDYRQRLVLPKAMDEVRHIDLSGGDFMPIAFPHDMLPYLKTLDLRGNEFYRSLVLLRMPALKELYLSPAKERADCLEEIALMYLPKLKSLIAEGFSCLREIQILDHISDQAEIETKNCASFERCWFL